MKETRSFLKGRMNKGVDKRILPEGEYIDAMNIRVNSPGNNDDIGAVQNAKGSRRLTELEFAGERLSFGAKCIGAYSDDTKETIYWFVYDPGGTNADGQTTDAVDMIVSYNMNTDQLVYHVMSVSVLNFNPQYLITGVNRIGDLLFFTDDLNPPRRINVTRHYQFPSGSPFSDNITEDDISVIVKPPALPPSINMVNTGAEENFIEDKLIAFAYRYRYRDGEYSALSSFSELAFLAKAFDFNRSSYDNGGMQNRFNAAEVTFNTGPSNVDKIQLCYKISDTNTISVIQTYDKADLGYTDNTDKTIVFDNSKAYAALPSNQLARAYDNVPLKAKAQTISGNRLVYGNYNDGRDLTDEDGNDVKIAYTSERRTTTSAVFKESAPTTFFPITYDIESPSSTKSVDGKVTIDFNGISLLQNNTISLVFVFTRDNSASTYVQTPDEGGEFEFEITYTLPTDYNSVHELFSSTEFLLALGRDMSSQPGTTNIRSIITSETVNNNNFCSGATFTDQYMCAYERSRSRSNLSVVGNGIDSLGVQVVPPSPSIVETRQIEVSSTAGSTGVSFSFPMFKLNHDSTDYYEYFDITALDFFSSQGANGSKSLHSNRDYDLGIVYLDEHNRATTVLTSENNTTYVPASGSDEVNIVRARVPITQKPPSWASKYKFFLKSSGGDYDSIFSDVVYVDSTDGTCYFKLEGDNQNKMKTGDVLTVKADSSGALNTLQKVTVLDIEAFGEGLLPGNAGNSLQGLYMSIKPGASMSVENAGTDVVSINPESVSTRNMEQPPIEIKLFDGSGNIPINAGDRVSLKIRHKRDGTTARCEEIVDEFRIDRFVAQVDYANFKEFFDGHNGGINWADIKFDSGAATLPVRYYGNTGTSASNAIFYSSGDPLPVNNKHKFQFINASGGLVLLAQAGADGCRANKKMKTTAKVEIIRNSGFYAFETQPEEITSEIYYEGNQVFDVSADGAGKLVHKGNTQDQDTATNADAICDLNFHNCYTFYNGVESLSIGDRIASHKFFLGERASIEVDTEYKEADRFASMTYSGFFNDETNYNSLNEFNLADINYKDLDKNFGEIMILADRSEDILALQEDRISRILVSKNILSDDEGSELLAKSNTFLGNQLPRPEEFGISRNAESFAKYGYDYYFTDAKRGAVIRVSGTGARGQNDQIAIVSNVGMKSYFRDSLKSSINKVTLGEYDEHSQEYVLSSTGSNLPAPTFVEPCNIIINRFIDSEISEGGSTTDTEVEVGDTVGDIAIEVDIENIRDFVADGDVTSNPSPKSTGTATDTGATNKLIDESQTFTTSVVVGDVVRVDSTQTAVPIATIDSDTQLGFASKIGITQGQPYTIISAADSLKLIDTNATFVTSGVTTACQLRNKRTGQITNVAAVTSETEISLSAGIFTIEDPYEITKAAAAGVTPTITWNGVAKGGSGSPITTDTTYTFTKTSAKPTRLNLNMAYPSGLMGSFKVTAPCPSADRLNVYYIMLTSDEDNGSQVNYNASRIESGGYIASEGGQFSCGSGIGAFASEFIGTAGLPGNGIIPAVGDTIRMAAFNSESFTLDDMTTSTRHDFKHLLSSTQYTSSDIQTILSSATTIPTVTATGAGNGYFGDFNLTSRASGEDHLYLVWDLRNTRTGTFNEVSPVTSFDDDLYDVCCTGSSTSIYYIDADDKNKVTGVFTTPNMTTSASDGLYSLGDGVAYYVNSGALADIVTCPTCAEDCSTFSEGGDGVSLAQELYKFPVELNTTTGAVIVRLRPNQDFFGNLSSTPNHAGMMISSLGSSSYNSYTSSLDGFVEKFFSHSGVVAPLPSSGSATIPFTIKEWDGTNYNLGGTQNLVVNSGEVTSATGGAEYVMVIPKTTATPSRLLINLFLVKSQLFNVNVACPAALPSFQIAGPITVYHSTFSGGTGGVPVRYNYVFTDANGVTKVSAGTFNTTGVSNMVSITVDANGIITKVIGSFTGFYHPSHSTTACAGTPATTYYHDATGTAGTPIVGDTIYSDAAGTSIVSSGFYKVGTDVLTVDSSGVVTNKAAC